MFSSQLPVMPRPLPLRGNRIYVMRPVFAVGDLSPAGPAPSGSDAAPGPSRPPQRPRAPKPAQADGAAAPTQPKPRQSRPKPGLNTPPSDAGPLRVGKPKPKRTPVELGERDPMYQPSLKGEQLKAEPADHRSGYVAIIGRPNAGKSTLMNALLGQKLSIVTPKAQTTRHRILGIVSDDAFQMVMLDTPGVIIKQNNKLEERMMKAVKTAIRDADALLAIIDASDRPDEALEMVQPAEGASLPPMGVLLNKADLLSETEREDLVKYFQENCRAEKVFLVSAKDNDGLDEVKAWAASKLPLGPSFYPKEIVAEQPERFFVTELIREKIFEMYAQEVPYGCQVNVAEFKERKPPAKDYILAEIWVEREGHRPILIGREGAALKRLSMESRRSVEAFLEREVYLELSIKVKKDWRDDDDLLVKNGY